MNGLKRSTLAQKLAPSGEVSVWLLVRGKVEANCSDLVIVLGSAILAIMILIIYLGIVLLPMFLSALVVGLVAILGAIFERRHFRDGYSRNLAAIL